MSGKRRDQSHSSLVLSVLAPDRPGIVEKISQLVSKHEGSWFNSRLSRIGGWFGGLVEVSVSQKQIGPFTRALEELGASDGIKIVTKTSTEERPKPRFQFVVEILGNENPGVIERISVAFNSRQINVDELRTRFYSAPISGVPVFKAQLTGAVRQSESLEGLRNLLEGIASDMMVDIEIKSMNTNMQT